MKKAFLFLTALVTLSSFAVAADNAPIEQTFQRYWSAYSKKDFAQAAVDVLPSDLEAAKTALLPVFLGAQSHANKDVQAIVTAFFGRTVGKARETMSPAEVFAGLNRIAMANNPDMFEMLKDATTSIVFVRRPTDDDAEVHFQVSLRGASDMDAETLTRKNGRWWVRLNEDPQEMAANFKAMLAGKS